MQPSHNHLTIISQPSRSHLADTHRHSQTLTAISPSCSHLCELTPHTTPTGCSCPLHAMPSPHSSRHTNARPHGTMRLVLFIQENTLTILQSRHLMHSHAFTSTNRTAHMNQSPPRTASRFHPRQTVVLVPDTRHGRSLAIARHAVLLAIA